MTLVNTVVVVFYALLLVMLCVPAKMRITFWNMRLIFVVVIVVVVVASVIFFIQFDNDGNETKMKMDHISIRRFLEKRIT